MRRFRRAATLFPDPNPHPLDGANVLPGDAPDLGLSEGSTRGFQRFSDRISDTMSDTTPQQQRLTATHSKDAGKQVYLAFRVVTE